MLLLWKIKKPVTGKDVLFFKHIKLRTGGESLTTLTAIFIFLLLLGKRVILGEEPKNGFPARPDSCSFPNEASSITIILFLY